MPKNAAHRALRARYPRAAMPSALSRTLLAGALALLAGCDAFQSFETVCEERLPAAKIEVVAEPVTYSTDLSRSSAELAAKSTHSGSRTLMGLVTADLKSAVSVGGSGIANRDRSRFCMRPAVKVNLAFSPMIVHVARELPEGSCGHRITLAHEQKHVSVYEQYLGEISREIDESLRAELGRKVLYFRSEAEGDAHVQKILQERIGPYVENAMRQVVVLQKQVDSPEEYARLDRAQAECEARNAKDEGPGQR
jgi:hypothetical protein